MKTTKARGYGGRFRARKNDRTSPEFWKNEAREHAKQYREQMQDYAEFCRRFRGDLSAVPYNDGESSSGGRPAGYGNLTQLRARIMRGDFMFRCPRPQVASPRYERAVFTPTLAQIETLLLRDFVEETDYYREMRRAFLDVVLAPLCVVKLGVQIDDELEMREIRRERMNADVEFKLYLMGAVKGPMAMRPRVKSGDSHVTHAVQHAQVIAAAQRGEILVPDEAIEVMERHLQDHLDRMSSPRETENSRRGRVTVRRIHPENYAFDVWAERPADREWHRETVIERIEDAEANPDYDKEAVKAIQPCKVRRGRRDGSGVTDETDWNRDSIQTLDLHFQKHEVVDLVESQVVVYAEGGTRPLCVRPWTLASIWPSGPYEEMSLIEDPGECTGVCPPRVGKDHQEASSMLMGIGTETTRRGLPATILNGSVFSAETIEKLRNGDVAELIVADNLPPDFDMSRVMAQVKPAEIPAQNVGMERMHRDLSAQLLGTGSAREAGGDDSKTATASTIISQSINSLAADGGSAGDEFQGRVLKKAIRGIRGCYSQRQVQDVVGADLALRQGGWPAEGFADADVRDDRAVGIVPGSSQRNESAILAKMLMDYVIAFQAGPLGMTMPKTTAELWRRAAEAMGQYGLGFDEIGEVATLEQQMAEQQAAAAAAGDPNAQPGVPPGEEEGGPSRNGKAKASRPSEAREPSHAGQNGGLSNTGGGRMATGASAGDGPRFMR